MCSLLWIFSSTLPDYCTMKCSIWSTVIHYNSTPSLFSISPFHSVIMQYNSSSVSHSSLNKRDVWNVLGKMKGEKAFTPIETRVDADEKLYTGVTESAPSAAAFYPHHTQKHLRETTESDTRPLIRRCDTRRKWLELIGEYVTLGECQTNDNQEREERDRIPLEGESCQQS